MYQRHLCTNATYSFIVLTITTVANTTLHATDHKEQKQIVKTSNPFKQADKAFIAGKYDRATRLYQKKIDDIEHQLRVAKVNRAEALIGSSRLEEGFKEFDARLAIPDVRHVSKRIRRDVLKKPYTGQDVQDKTILVRGEHGFGDVVFFARYCEILQKQGAYVIVSAHPAMLSVLQECPYISQVVSENDDLALQKLMYDYDIFMMSLPQYFSRNGCSPTRMLQDIPHSQIQDGPHLQANPALVEWWHGYLKENHNFEYHNNVLVCVC